MLVIPNMLMMVNWMVIWHIILCLILIPLGISVNKKLYHNIKNEEHLEKGQIIQRIIKTFSIIQCILWPSCLILSTPFLESNILNELASAPKFYLTQFSRCLSTFLRHYSGFHSLIIAVSRYVFIVFNGKAEKIGVKRLRTFFISTSIEVPMLLTIVEFLFFPAKGWISHFRFSNEYSLMDVRTNHSETAHHSIDIDIKENVFYLAIQKYIHPAPIGIIKCILLITAAIIYSNIAEGLIYGHIFMFTYRYENSILFVYELLKSNVSI